MAGESVFVGAKDAKDFPCRIWGPTGINLESFQRSGPADTQRLRTDEMSAGEYHTHVREQWQVRKPSNGFGAGCLQRTHKGLHERKRQLCIHVKPRETTTRVSDSIRQVKPVLLHIFPPQDLEGKKWPGELGKRNEALLWKKKKSKWNVPFPFPQPELGPIWDRQTGRCFRFIWRCLSGNMQTELKKWISFIMENFKHIPKLWEYYNGCATLTMINTWPVLCHLYTHLYPFPLIAWVFKLPNDFFFFFYQANENFLLPESCWFCVALRQWFPLSEP